MTQQRAGSPAAAAGVRQPVPAPPTARRSLARRLASLACLLPLALGASPETGPALRFVNPPNGARDVARMPVLSLTFAEPVPDDPVWLGARIRLLDRLGRAVPVLLRRSADDPRLALASPAGPAERLLPASDYFLEVGSGAHLVRTHFLTGGDKSVFCVRPRGPGVWENACDESYWRGDPGPGGSCGAPDPEIPCLCSMVASPESLGGRAPVCRCLEEEAYWLGKGRGRVFVASLEPAPGSAVAPPPRVALRLSRALGAEESGAYRLRIDDVTDGAAEPALVHAGAAQRDGQVLWLASPKLASERRYRVTLLRPPNPDAQLVGAHVYGASWTFNTWLKPGSPRLERLVPSARSPGVRFPTHLPSRPHLRLLASAPLAAAAGDLDGPVLELRKHTGERVRGYATWYDLDMERLHLMVYQALDAGERYELRCTAALAAALGQGVCTETPIGHFLVQAPEPPASGIADLRYGARAEHEPDDELWLPVRPTIFDHAHGVKERYRRDALGPVQFLAHVLLVPDDEPAGALVLRVDPSSCARGEPARPCEALLSGAQTSCSLDQALRCAGSQDRPTVVELAPGRHAAFRVAARPGGAPVLIRGRRGAPPPRVDGLRALSNGLELPASPLALPRAPCRGTPGFRWDEARGVCRPDPSDSAFACAPDSGCRSRWVQSDKAHNLWRLWWPPLRDRRRPPGLEFGLFANADGDAPRVVPLVDTRGADVAPCRFSTDPGGCALQRCSVWSAATLAEQRERKLTELRGRPAPAALWLPGHRVAAADGCRKLDTYRSFRIEQRPGAPAALYLKLPAGRSPADLALRGAPADEAGLLLQGVANWTLRGLRLPMLAASVVVRDAKRVRFEGVQFAGTTRAAVRTEGTSGLAIAHSSFRGTPPLEYSSLEPGFEIHNSLLLGVSGKAIKSRRPVVAGETPSLCSAEQPDCLRPWCRVDHDCRIPFLAADGTLGAGAASDTSAAQPRCTAPEQAGEPGRCSHGLAGQTLISDNVFLGAAGLDGGHWYALRLQRNHFEGTSGQELLDASLGAAFVSLLDNVSFGSSSRSRLILFRASRGSDRPAWLRALAIEGNYILQTTPDHPALDLRRGPLRLAAHTAFLTTWQSRLEEGLEASGLRVVDNVILGRPGGREWGLGRSGGISAVDVDDVFIARNTIVVDTEIGIEVRQGLNGVAPSGRAAQNLVVATSRTELHSNLCEKPPGPSLRTPDSRAFSSAGNAAVRGSRGAPGAAANLTLAPGDRERLLAEPLPASPPIDMETFQRQAAPTALEVHARRRSWPLYEPALLDDVLQVRPGHRACAIGARRHPGCDQAGSGSRGPK